MAATTVWATDPDELFFKGTADVNEGQLHFLTAPPDRPVHHHHNRITILDSSLEDGWVRLDQCHTNLDAVPSAEVTYRPGRVRNLRVTRAVHIEDAWVEAHSVQLRNVQHGAELCVEAETQALSVNGESSYSLSNGPYMRRFLDGFYPMRVSMTVRLDTDKLHFVESIPAEQPGFRLEQRDKEIGYDALFEGILYTVLRFDRVQP
ncbi:MAG: hypothetical protein ACUVT2_01855 [Thiobacillaceae bacterium]